MLPAHYDALCEEQTINSTRQTKSQNKMRCINIPTKIQTRSFMNALTKDSLSSCSTQTIPTLHPFKQQWTAAFYDTVVPQWTVCSHRPVSESHFPHESFSCRCYTNIEPKVLLFILFYLQPVKIGATLLFSLKTSQ